MLQAERRRHCHLPTPRGFEGPSSHNGDDGPALGLASPFNISEEQWCFDSDDILAHSTPKDEIAQAQAAGASKYNTADDDTDEESDEEFNQDLPDLPSPFIGSERSDDEDDLGFSTQRSQGILFSSSTTAYGDTPISDSSLASADKYPATSAQSRTTSTLETVPELEESPSTDSLSSLAILKRPSRSASSTYRWLFNPLATLKEILNLSTTTLAPQAWTRTTNGSRTTSRTTTTTSSSLARPHLIH